MVIAVGRKDLLLSICLATNLEKPLNEDILLMFKNLLHFMGNYSL